MRVPRSIGACASLALVAGFFAATPALTAAAAAPQMWVNQSAVPGTDTSCANPGFQTISDALTAAPSGAVITVCAGTYNEQLVITKAVTLKSSGSVTVVGPGDSTSDTATSCDADGPNNQDAVDICVPGRVVLTGITFNAGFSSGYCNDDYIGVAVLGGATLNMSQSVVENIGGGADIGGCQGGIGIQVGEAISPTAADAGHATLNNDTVETYQKGGIVVDGVGSTATMNGVSVTGAGPAPIAQNGIQISDGGKATISGAIVTGNECDLAPTTCGSDPDTDAQSIGILLYDAGTTTVKNSTVTGNDLGVYNLGDLATAYYTPPSPFNITATFTNVTMSNRYENAGADSGKTLINNSHISGSQTGISVFQYSGQPIGATFSGTKDTITGASIAAVYVDSDAQAGDLPYTASITHSSFNATNAAGVQNTETNMGTGYTNSVVTATDDWWGNATGPSLWSFGGGTKVYNDVNFFPWALTASINTFKTCTSGTNLSTSGNDVVLCASGTGNATLTNHGSGAVLLLGNSGNDHLNASATGATYIIAAQGHNTINGNNGTQGWFQLRGNTHDTLVNDSFDSESP